MSVHTRSQKLAQAAFAATAMRKKEAEFDDYISVAKKFPALIHSCGLAQAVAFALSKRKKDKPRGVPEIRHLADLVTVLRAGGHPELTDPGSLDNCCRTDGVTTYLRLSRDSIDAAVWLKRYAEALSGAIPVPAETKT